MTLNVKALVSDRSRQFTESVIREMTRLALTHNAVNLSQGFPDFDPPSEMLEAAVNAIRGGFNQYAVTWGTKNLRNAIAGKFGWYQGLAIDPEKEITVTCGSTEAMIASLLAVINPGDEVVIFEPFYENYGPDAVLSNAAPRYVPLRAPSPHAVTAAPGSGKSVSRTQAWRFDFDELAGAFSNRTKAVIINTPNNPTGKVFTREELEFIASLCQKWGALAITDEIYEHILYDGHTHVSIATLPGMRERTITINAISKTYSATGWRVGWAVAPPEITSAIRKVHDFLTVGAPHPLQEAAAAALRLDKSYYGRLAGDYLKRREFLLTTLVNAGFQCWKPFGAYYIMTDFSQVKRWKKGDLQNDAEFARWLVSDIGVAAVPGSSFYREPALGRTKLRFSFGRRAETLEQAAKRLHSINN